jgi:3-dehydroquinate synthase
MEINRLTIQLPQTSYPVMIGRGLTERLGEWLDSIDSASPGKVCIISDEHVAPRYADSVQDALNERGWETYVYTIAAGESSKSLKTYEQVLTYLFEKHFDRTSLLLALGGGVVGDLTGFVASTFMRGIKYIQMPTTVLAHDSSVGGKVAINHPLGKNLIGSFYHPLAVLYDTQFLHSLPAREVRAGFAEVIKLGLIRDEAFYHWMNRHAEHCLNLEEPYLSQALYRACQIKAEIVSEDEKEQGLRAILNFGHTFGHAFEALSAYNGYSHGEAVAIGMIYAARLSEKVTGLSLVAEIARTLQKYQLPTRLNNHWPAEQIVEQMFRDKKTTQGSLKLIGLERIGKANILEHVSVSTVLDVLREMATSQG